jgi:hypothetical protein
LPNLFAADLFFNPALLVGRVVCRRAAVSFTAADVQPFLVLRLYFDGAVMLMLATSHSLSMGIKARSVRDCNEIVMMEGSEPVKSNTPEIGQRVAMVVPVSLEDSERDELYALPDDRSEDTPAIDDKTRHSCYE